MLAIGQILRNLREERNMSLQSAKEATGIEITLLSRIETGKRLPTDEQLLKLSQVYNFDIKTLRVQRDSDRIITSVESSDIAKETIKVASEKLAYGDEYLKVFQDSIFDNLIPLESRRYIGSKSKLTSWIMDIVDNYTKDVHTFCDIFAGTGTVANRAVEKFEHIIINDFLFSNQVVYEAFFGEGDWDKSKLCNILNTYNSLNSSSLADNWFSSNYGDKYYDYNVAKMIGYIRQDIEDRKETLTHKEYSILLATLIYNIDKLANTVGHFDAYIKKPIKSQQLVLRLIDAHSYPNVNIYREDSNLLARRITSDLVYIDPPYNSRQYSRFYHLYETLIKWDKPVLYGVALKPAAENMSEYCTVRAVDAFRDLILNLNTRYIIVSYNNTYNSKSHSSENKIQLDDMKHILEEKGQTQVFEHAFQAFNAGKTDLEDHKEILFVTTVK